MAKLGKILGSISPLAGTVTGQGLFGAGLANLGTAMGPMAGIMPAMAKAARDKRRTRAEEAEKEAKGMKHGGKAKKMAKGGSASKRGDGCAQRGKTKGKMV